MHLERIQKLQKILPCAAYLVEDPVDLYYLTGLNLSAGVLIVTPKTAELYVDGRYREVASGNAPITVHLIEEKSPFENLLEIGLDSESTSVRRFQELEAKKIKLITMESLVAQLRMIKDKGEQDLMRRAAQLGTEGYHYVLSLLHEGISEIEVALELEIFWKRKGAKGVAFDPIIAFGSNSSMPHYRAGNRKLSKNDIVLIDIGVNLNHYHSDMTRVHFLGDVAPELKRIHGIVLEASEKARALCKPGARVGDLDAAARDCIEENGYKLPHSLGHGVGLCVHEAPWLRNKAPWCDLRLEPGMAITIEPGIYLPGLGGVRLEDTIIIQADGYEDLTRADYLSTSTLKA